MFHPSVRYLYRLTETESVMEKVKRYIDEHRERFVEELFSLLRIPSISADSAHRGDMSVAPSICATRFFPPAPTAPR